MNVAFWNWPLDLSYSDNFLAVFENKHSKKIPKLNSYQHLPPKVSTMNIQAKVHQDSLPALLTIENGEKVQSTFSKEEYENRHRKLRQMMADQQVDSVLFSSMHNINYYVDFLYCSFGRFFGVVVTDQKVVSISANIDGGQPWRRTVGDYNVVYTDWQRDNYFRAVAQEIPNKGRVGVEFDHLPIERLNKLKAFLPNVEFVDISAACMKLRMVKSLEEIAHINMVQQYVILAVLP